ncbi:MAG: peptidoglycan DD-metalloendopeptidase family protein [Deltaproteobacteria bacterium]|jgi:LysM repeat protein|nr:peptidoglycan DD-metalloendopeptidase family protein [Deltaproteobacteria bacterium]MBT4527757.1 peptidoglycan DD-metalloendopeptidase family protein [Deltaproteobacteria bacterium]
MIFLRIKFTSDIKYVRISGLLLMVISVLILNGCSISQKEALPEIGFWHTFKHEDTLEKISSKYSVSLNIIQKKNDIYDSEDLVPGMKIFIPGVRHVTKSSHKPVPRLQFIWPAKGVISSGYGTRHGRKHDGIDITKDNGRKIVASASGTIEFKGWKKGYGKVLIINHGNGFKTLYAHNQTLYVDKNQYVNQGQKIAYMGSTGISSGIHLHFEIQKNGKPINPLRYLQAR